MAEGLVVGRREGRASGRAGQRRRAARRDSQQRTPKGVRCGACARPGTTKDAGTGVRDSRWRKALLLRAAITSQKFETREPDASGLLHFQNKRSGPTHSHARRLILVRKGERGDVPQAALSASRHRDKHGTGAVRPFAEAAPGWVQSGAVIERLNVGGGRRGAKCWLLSVRGHGGFKSRRRANRGCPKHAAAAARKVI